MRIILFGDTSTFQVLAGSVTSIVNVSVMVLAAVLASLNPVTVTNVSAVGETVPATGLDGAAVQAKSDALWEICARGDDFAAAAGLPCDVSAAMQTSTRI